MSLSLWQLDLRALPDGFEARCNAVLTEAEQAKADTYRQALDRQRFRLGRGLTRLVSSCETGIAPLDLQWRASDTGKPSWANTPLSFNVSHSGDLIWLVLGGTAPLGVDVQIDEPHIDAEAIADFALCDAELTYLASLPETRRRQGFFDLWVLREAALKATGQGVFTSMKKVSALPIPPADGWGSGANLGNPQLWLTDVNAPAGYRAALAILSASAPEKRPVLCDAKDLFG